MASLMLINADWCSNGSTRFSFVGAYLRSSSGHFSIDHDQSLCLIALGCLSMRKETTLELIRSGWFRWAWWRPGTTWYFHICNDWQKTPDAQTVGCDSWSQRPWSAKGRPLVHAPPQWSGEDRWLNWIVPHFFLLIKSHILDRNGVWYSSF